MWKIVQLYQLSIKQKWKGTYTWSDLFEKLLHCGFWLAGRHSNTPRVHSTRQGRRMNAHNVGKTQNTHTHTHAETVTYSLIYMHSIVHHKLVIMVITIIAIVVINHPDPWNFLAPSCFSRHRARLFSGRLSSGRLCDMNGHSIFWPLGIWLVGLVWLGSYPHHHPRSHSM